MKLGVGGPRAGPLGAAGGPMSRIDRPAHSGPGGVECCFVRCCTCVHVEFVKSMPGVVKALETVLSGMIQSLLIKYGMTYHANIGSAFEGALTTSSACFFTCAVLLLCYVVSERSYRYVRASLFELTFNWIACFLYLSSGVYLAFATKLFLWPMSTVLAGFDAYPAMTAAYALCIVAGLLFGMDACYCIHEFRQR